MKCLRWRSNRHKFYLVAVCAALFFLNRHFVGTRSSFDEEDEQLDQVVPKDGVSEKTSDCEKKANIREQTCSADNGKTMRCWKDEGDVYFPFSFIKKRFDMSGKMSKDGSTFEMMTSYSRMRVPDTKYDPVGVFGHFATYSVETRDRVRCINGVSDVPMSTQWSPKPYYYPIQIAQYGLQHYSRLKTDGNADKHEEVILGEKSSEWKGAAGMSDTTERLFFHDEEKGQLVNISAEAAVASAGAYVYLDKSPKLHIVSFEWMPVENASFTVLVKMREGGLLVLLNYVSDEDTEGVCVRSDDDSMAGKDGQVSFSYFCSSAVGEWSTVTRDVLVDVSRALSNNYGRKKEENVVLHPGDIRLVSIGFRGKLTVRRRICQANEHHGHAFLAVADWLIKTQNEKGGWEVPVERSIAERRLVLPPGWHSAMAQGHGISVLTRAYHTTKKEVYLNSSLNAVRMFNMNASDSGVVNSFFGVPWFEEYPTTPGSFVLNGFMYSLLGLYDLSKLQLASEHDTLENRDKLKAVEALYRTGIDSLRRLLPLYDTGSGSIYDLRHVALGTAPNIARWDYHAVHVYLLRWISDIENDDLLRTTADRWMGYAYGKRAKHN